ncbi:hypothetical protein ID866_4164 [Astraeus odoratus]|nr:hypothetical protein ID866_4164 [Astraeus odoratus]
MPSSSAAPQVDGYRRTNNLLHELHVLHQHRLMFSPSESQCRASSGVSPPSMHRHPYSRGNAEVPLVLPQSSHMKPSIPQSSQRPSRPPHHIPEGQQCSDQAGLHEAQSVWERYEGANRLLGSLFLSRRRELQVAFSPHDASERQQI